MCGLSTQCNQSPTHERDKSKELNTVSSINEILSNIKESEHAIIHFCEQDCEIVELLLNIIERNYPRIANHLNHHLDKKITVELYPNIEIFHKAFDISDGPDWLIALITQSKIMMVSPLNPGNYHSYKSVFKFVE